MSVHTYKSIAIFYMVLLNRSLNLIWTAAKKIRPLSMFHLLQSYNNCNISFAMGRRRTPVFVLHIGFKIHDVATSVYSLLVGFTKHFYIDFSGGQTKMYRRYCSRVEQIIQNCTHLLPNISQTFTVNI